MRVPVEWLREMVDLPADVTARGIADRLIDAGLEVESVETMGEGVEGALVVGRVVSIEELTDFKKPIRWCQVDVGPEQGGVRGIICGARNFAAGDVVVVALPGAVLPGGFHIAARQTYGHVSDGMICSERELALGDDHAGIIVLSGVEADQIGSDARRLLGVGDEVLDIAVTPDRGYALSLRGVAREVAIAFGLPFADPGTRLADLPAPSDGAVPWPCSVDDPTVCELFTLRRIVGFDPHAPTPTWMRRRLVACGMRPVSLAVDVTNYVMLELGQPLHAFDGAKLSGPVRAARAGAETPLVTLDHVERTLDPEDIVIRDDTGPIGLAGTMGGLHTEIDDESTDLVLEAAHFLPSPVVRTARRHRLSSEASRRFERGVDRVLAPYASARAAELLLQLGGGAYVGMTAWEAPYEPAPIAMPADLPSRTSGMAIDAATTTRLLESVGCEVTATDPVLVTAPPWRPDLTDPADLVEEVVRLIGYAHLPSVLPTAPSGYGLTRAQRQRRRIMLALAGDGFVEVLTYPFLGDADLDALHVAADDPLRRAPRLANPLSDEQPMLRTTLLPGLLAVARRNLSRGFDDLALMEMGRVFRLRDGQRPEGVSDPPRPAVTDRPGPDDLAALADLLPDQPTRLGIVVTGHVEQPGWWGSGRMATWADALEAVRVATRAVGCDPWVRALADAPDDEAGEVDLRDAFHPGRAAEILVAGRRVAVAGELHPRVTSAMGVPARTAAAEIDVDALIEVGVDAVPGPSVGTQPVAKEDLALVVPVTVPSTEVADALAAGAGELCESVRLFDVYEGAQVPEGHRSLAFALRLRAPDRTLSAEEIAAVRSAAIERAGAACGAVLRGS